MALKFKYNKAELTAEVSGMDSDDTVAKIPETVEYYKKTYRVTEIGTYAFYNCTRLQCITIPNSVTKISSGAFMGCSSLQSITIPDSIKIVGGGVFKDCPNLKEFKGKFAGDDGRCLIVNNEIISYANSSGSTYEIPRCVTKIHHSAFVGCTSLQDITIHGGVTFIGSFEGCCSLQSITIPNGVICIESFRRCSSLKSITIPNGVISLGSFEGCSSLKSITIPNSVTIINDQTFAGCCCLKRITLPPSVRRIEDSAFACGIEVVDIYNEEGNVVIHPNAFNKGVKINYLGVKIPKSNAGNLMKEQQVVESVKDTANPEINKLDKEFLWGEKVWEPVKASLAANKVNLKAPKTNQSWIVFKLKSIDAQIVLAYNLGKNIATVQLETSSGEVVKYKISSKIAQTKESHVIRTAEVEQSKRNKDKWVWAVRKNINKNSPEIIKWYTDVMIDIYQAIED